MLYTNTNLSDEESDDGHCWPKHVVLSFSNKHQLDIHYFIIDLITLPIKSFLMFYGFVCSLQ